MTRRIHPLFIALALCLAPSARAEEGAQASTVGERGLFALSQSTARDAREDGPAWSAEGLPRGFQKIREIGQGSYANAVLVREIATGKLRVLKIARQSSDYFTRIFLRETHMLTASGKDARFYKNPESGACAISMDPVFQSPGSQTLAVPLSTVLSAHMLGGGKDLPPAYQITPETLPAWNRSIDAALADFHARGLRHNDIHLDNLLVRWDAQGNPVMELIDFGLASHEDDINPPKGATLFQSGPKFRDEPYDAAEADRYSATLVKAFLSGAAKGEVPTVKLLVPGGKAQLFQASAAALIQGELGSAVEPPAPPPPERTMSAREKQMLCEMHYAALYRSPPAPRPVQRALANVGR